MDAVARVVEVMAVRMSKPLFEYWILVREPVRNSRILTNRIAHRFEVRNPRFEFDSIRQDSRTSNSSKIRAERYCSSYEG